MREIRYNLPSLTHGLATCIYIRNHFKLIMKHLILPQVHTPKKNREILIFFRGAEALNKNSDKHVLHDP